MLDKTLASFCFVWNATLKDDKGSGENRIPYRQQVIRALVQRYIESARREFEEAKRKGMADKVFRYGYLFIMVCYRPHPLDLISLVC